MQIVQKRTVLFQRNTSYMFRAEDAYPAWHTALHRARHGRVAFDSRPGEFYGVAGYHQLHCVVCTTVPHRLQWRKLTVLL